MEPVTDFPDVEWDFSRISSSEVLDFTPEFVSHCLFPFEKDEGLQFTTPSGPVLNPEAIVGLSGLSQSLFYSWNALNQNLLYVSQETSNNSSTNCSGSSCGSVFVPTASHENHYCFANANYIPALTDTSMSMDICIMDKKNTGCLIPHFFPEIAMAENASVNEKPRSDMTMLLDCSEPVTNANPGKEWLLKRNLEVPQFEDNSTNGARKKPCLTQDVQQIKTKMQSKRNKKFTSNGNVDEEEESNTAAGQTSSSYTTEDDNASQDSNGGTISESKLADPVLLNSNIGKTRANRRSATDPQSLYARKRRERINERLRILQNLVPNGTKVDISTMLEEAVHYVKFLQLQIKLLSSDDLWMYAPIAYNGVDIGLNQKISMLV